MYYRQLDGIPYFENDDKSKLKTWKVDLGTWVTGEDNTLKLMVKLQYMQIFYQFRPLGL